MATNETESLLRYYSSELSYLRRLSASFARRYPKIAGRLELHGGESADPHVERMLESFALLTARLQRRLDGEFPEITTALLGVLYPHLVDPVPPMTIARFEVDAARGKLTSGHLIPAGSQLFARTSTNLTCRFRSSYPVTLWPIKVVEADLESEAQYNFADPRATAVLRLKLEAVGCQFEELDIEHLRFYLHGDGQLPHTLYELLFGHVLKVALLPEGSGKEPVYLPAGCIRPVGFAADEGVIPYPPHALPAYRLLQEYFLFPEKFLFFDLGHLDLRGPGPDQPRLLRGSTVEVVIQLDLRPSGRLSIDRETFSLGCTPAINLFRRTSEPIRIDQRRHEYVLDPDMRRERTTEIHSITAVSSSSNPMDPAQGIDPFYSFRHRLDGGEQRAFWYARRVPTRQEDLPGTDVLLSFADLDFNPAVPPEQVVFAHLWCTNRAFAAELPVGAMLELEDVVPLRDIRCLTKPTPPFYPPLGGASLWQLISNLSLNYLSLTDPQEGLAALREMLRLYSFSEQPSVHRQIQGLMSLSCSRKTRRVGSEPWRGFCYGTEITIKLNKENFAGSGAFLFGAVLDRFFALYASLNSFTELVVTASDREGIWKRWPPRSGEQALL
ncbi:MAG: type VI secretion system baseplate subunit TssF [Acidobacteria bacterium]|nr:type VI secretion system baseplate subunit TssF [Acidobacteriota bacterium]